MKSERKNGETIFHVQREPAACMASFPVTRPWQLTQPPGAAWLNENGHAAAALSGEEAAAVLQGAARAVNPLWNGAGIVLPKLPQGKKRLHLVALGDVGTTLLTGLCLLGGDVLSHIGIFDLNEAQVRRCAFEMNQIAFPGRPDAVPVVEPVSEEALFCCDVFVFCACKAVPPLDAGRQDVRMAQLAGNAAIIKHYARKARQAGYQGLFCVVSDPVDLLARAAFLYSNQDDAGVFDGLGLRPEQVQGYGLGVMYARALYYARMDTRCSDFPIEGRAFGPHGQALVLANSIVRYDDALSLQLTEQVVNANLELRETGFKPYIAPALSSGAISILLTLRGEWHYSAIPLGRVYFGCYNRLTSKGIEWEMNPLPQPLMERLQTAYDTLMEQEKLL